MNAQPRSEKLAPVLSAIEMAWICWLVNMKTVKLAVKRGQERDRRIIRPCRVLLNMLICCLKSPRTQHCGVVTKPL